MRKEYYYLLAGVAIGLIAAPQLRRLPIVSKIPTV
jgi:hypothetical protein